MKVGNLTFISICGCCKIVIGPNPFVGLFVGIFISGFMCYVMLNMAWGLTSDLLRYIAYFGITLDMALFILLSVSDPGLPS